MELPNKNSIRHGFCNKKKSFKLNIIFLFTKMTWNAMRTLILLYFSIYLNPSDTLFRKTTSSGSVTKKYINIKLSGVFESVRMCVCVLFSIMPLKLQLKSNIQGNALMIFQCNEQSGKQ